MTSSTMCDSSHHHHHHHHHHHRDYGHNCSVEKPHSFASQTLSNPIPTPVNSAHQAIPTNPVELRDVGALLELGLALGHQRFEIVSLAERDQSGMAPARPWEEPQPIDLPPAVSAAELSHTSSSINSRIPRRRRPVPDNEPTVADRARPGGAGEEELRGEVGWLRERVGNLGRELEVARRDSNRLATQLKQEEKVGREQRRRADEAVREATALREEVQRLKEETRTAAIVVSRAALSDAQDRTVRMAERRRRQQAESLMQWYKGLYEQQLESKNTSDEILLALERRTNAPESAPHSADNNSQETPVSAPCIGVTTRLTSVAASAMAVSSSCPVDAAVRDKHRRTTLSSTGSQEAEHVLWQSDERNRNSAEMSCTRETLENVRGRAASTSLLPSPSSSTCFVHDDQVCQDEQNVQFYQAETTPLVVDHHGNNKKQHGELDGTEERNLVELTAPGSTAATPGCRDKLPLEETAVMMYQKGFEECARRLVRGAIFAETGGCRNEHPSARSVADATMSVVGGQSDLQDAANTFGLHGEGAEGELESWRIFENMDGATLDSQSDQDKSPTISESTVETIASSPVMARSQGEGRGDDVTGEQSQDTGRGNIVVDWSEGEKKESGETPPILLGRDCEMNHGESDFRAVLHLANEVSENNVTIPTGVLCESDKREHCTSSALPAGAKACPFPAGSPEVHADGEKHSHRPNSSAEHTPREFDTGRCLSRLERCASDRVVPAPSWRGRCYRAEAGGGQEVTSSLSWAESRVVDAPKRSSSPVPARRGRWEAGVGDNRAWGDEGGDGYKRIEPFRTRPHSI